MTPWIQNVSLANVESAWHYDPGPNSLLIRIVDPDMEFPRPMYPFGTVRGWKFLDSDGGPGAIDEVQAIEIADVLRVARALKSNVVVSCVAGLCRSGAVVEAAVRHLNFHDTEELRMPNIRVLTLLTQALQS